MNWLNKVSGILLCVGISAIPIYVFSSGGIQPAHMIFALFIVIVIMSNGIASELPIISIAILAIYAFAVEYFYLIRTNIYGHLIDSVYLLFNFLLTSSVYCYLLKSGFGVVRFGVIAAISVSLVSIILSGVDLKEFGDSGREVGTFNNPNQLGYFSVCVLSISYILYRAGNIGFVFAIFCFASALFISIVSLSKAAMMANAVVIIFAIFPHRSAAKILLWILVSALMVGFTVKMILSGELDDYLFVRRMLGMFDENDSSLEARGYFAFMKASGFQILFGMGADQVYGVVGHEVHSTMGGIANNYGLVGLTICCVIFFSWAYRIYLSAGWVSAFCIVAPPMLYGLTHNGIRFSIFWIMIAISMAWANREFETRVRQIKMKNGRAIREDYRLQKRPQFDVSSSIGERRKKLTELRRSI